MHRFRWLSAKLVRPHPAFLNEWREIGGVSALRMTKDQRIWTGGVLRDLEGKEVAKLPTDVGGAGGAHGIAVTDSGDVYVGQLSGVVQKFVMGP